MAVDPATVKAGTAGSDVAVAADLDGLSNFHQLVKVEWGVDGTQTMVAAGAAALPIQDGGNSITVDGTVTVTGVSTLAEQQSQTALLTTIDADTGNIVTSVQLLDDTVFAEDVAATAGDKGIAILAVRRDADTTLVDATNDYANLQVDARGALKVEVFSGETLPVSLASAPSTAVTNAGTFVVHENGAALTALQLIDDIVYTDDTSTHATGTSKGALIMAAATPTDTAVNANDIGALAMTLNRELLVQVNTALPAGAAAIGTVGVTSIVPGTAATNLGKPEDGPHTTGDVGVMALGVRSDAGGAFAADGDYVPLSMDASGAVRVTGGGGGTQYTEDIAAAADPVGNAVILVRKDTPAATVSADGDNIAQRGNNFGAAYATLLDSAGAFILPAAAALADNTANPTLTGIGSYGMLFDGSTWDRAPGNSTGGIYNQGPVAHDATVASAAHNPLPLGAYSQDDGNPTAVSGDADVVRLIADRKGRQIIRPIPFVTTIRVNSANLTTATTAYTAGDTLGLASSVPATFASAARVSGGTGVIRGIYVLDKADITGTLTVFVFRSSVTLAADNAAWSVSDTDMEACVLRQQISMTDEGNQRVGFWSGYTPFDCNASDLFVAIRTDTAHTFFGAASDIRTALFIVQD